MRRTVVQAWTAPEGTSPMTESPIGRSGWISWGPEGPSPDLPEEVREELLRRQAEREEQRGPLLAIVNVRVWQNGEGVPQVTVPTESPLPMDDREQVADVVRIAREALAAWG
jgi:hypothetical protein